MNRAQPRTIVVIAKPASSDARADELQHAVERLRADGCDVSIEETHGRGEAARRAEAAGRAGVDVVAAAGGDGTVNEVVNGLVKSGSDTALAVVPMGTANDFAQGLGLPLDIEAALRLAAEGQAAELDVARVNDRCFINVSTGGFGADATRSASKKVKRFLGPLAYAAQGAHLLLRFTPTAGEFVADGESVYSGRYVFFAVGNARRTGGGAYVTPHADPGDGKLDVMILCEVSRRDFLALLPDLRAGSHIESPAVLYVRASTLELSAGCPLRVNADGEPVEGSVFRYSVLERGLRVVGG
jgi:diacylglycerol kinase (ATP)